MDNQFQDSYRRPAHRMRVAKVSPVYAKRNGLSANHHLRVWCECMDHPVSSPGTWSVRSPERVRNDPRRLGSYDHLGVVDMRVPFSALQLFKQHVKESEDVG